MGPLKLKRALRRAHQRRRPLLHARCVKSALVRWAAVGQGADGRHVPPLTRLDCLVSLRKVAYSVRLRALSRAIKQASDRDEAEFTRRTFQESVGEGPAALAKLLRAVLKTGRRYKAPSMAIALKQDDEWLVEPRQVSKAFAAHFANIEEATPVQFRSLPNIGTHLCSADTLDATGLPTLAQLTRIRKIEISSSSRPVRHPSRFL